VPLYVVLFLPWVITHVFTFKFYEGGMYGFWILTNRLARTACFLACLVVGNYLLILHSAKDQPTLGGYQFEQLVAVYFLQFTWFVIFFSNSLLVAVLWLELAGLLAILLLGFFGLPKGETTTLFVG